MRNCSSASMKAARQSRRSSGRHADLLVGWRAFVFRLLTCAISASQLMDFAVSLIRNLRQQEKIGSSEAVGVLPVPLVVTVAALEGDGVIGLAVRPVLPD